MLGLLHPSQALLQGYADGELSGTSKERLSNHLRDCTRCRERVSALRALGIELGTLPAPSLPPEGLAAVAAARGAGVRTLLPEAPAQPSRLSLKWAAAAAAVVVLSAVVIQTWRVLPARRDSQAGSSGGFFVPTTLFGQGARQAPDTMAKYPLVTRLDGSRLVPVRLVYRQNSYGAGGEEEHVVSIQRSQVGTRQTWLVTTESLGPYGAWYVDSVVLDRQDLRPLQRVYRRRHDYHLVYTFSRDSVHAFQTSPRWAKRWGRDSLRAAGRLPVPNSSSIAVPYWYTSLVTIGAAPLASTWRGSFYGVYGTPRPAGVGLESWPINLAVVGDDIITVPGGTFPCWKVIIHQRIPIWISKEQGWIVAFASGRNGEELVSYEVGR